jgi:drug/metabolite transporter (DMT)-like permease
MGSVGARLLVASRVWSATTWGLFAVVAIVWGLNYIFVNVGLAVSGPLWLATLRAAFGLAGSAAILAVVGRPTKLDRRGRRDAFLIGMPNITLFFAFWFLAAGTILPGVAAVMIYTYPLWVAILSAPVLSHALTARHWASVAVGFAGVVLVSQVGSFTGAPLAVVPIVELLIAAFAWALATVVIQRRFRGEEMLEANVYQLVGGAVGLLVLTLVLTPTALPVVTRPELWVSVLWLGVLGTAVAYSIWFHLLGRTRAATLSAYLFLVPVVAMTASAVVFRERLSYLQLVGVAFVLASIYGIGRAPGGSELSATGDPTSP